MRTALAPSFSRPSSSCGELALAGLAIASFVTGCWAFGLVLLFIAAPIWWFVEDLVTAPTVGPVALAVARRAEVRP
jgi:hypothetical protein